MAVIERHHLAAWMPLAKVQQTANISAHPCKERLDRITNHDEVVVLGGQQLEERPLCRVQVLCLVGEDALIAQLQHAQGFGVFAEQAQWQAQHSNEVDRAMLSQALLVRLRQRPCRIVSAGHVVG